MKTLTRTLSALVLSAGLSGAALAATPQNTQGNNNPHVHHHIAAQAVSGEH